jgi:PAS domain S-box-containing protein/diguanylate cyclase (GGDEF)-like protein
LRLLPKNEDPPTTEVPITYGPRLVDRSGPGASTVLDAREAARHGVESVLDVAQADGVALYWWDEEQRVLVPLAAAGKLLGTQELPIVHPGQGVVGAAYEQRAPVLVPRRYDASPHTTVWGREYGIETAYAVPLIVRRRVHGVLAVVYGQARTVDDGLARVIELTARQIAPTLTVMRLLVDAQRSINESVTLAKLIRDTASHVDLNTTCARITETACRLVGAEYAAIGVYEEDASDRFYGVWGSRTALWKQGYYRHVEDAIAADLERGRSVLVRHLRQRDDVSQPEFSLAVAEGAETVMLTPLGAGKEALGWLHLGWRVNCEPTLRQAALVENLAKHASTVIAHAREIERIVAEQEEHTREEHYRALAEHAADLVLVVDIDTVVRYASPSHRTRLGWNPETMLGRRSLDFVVPEDLTFVKEHLARSDSAKSERFSAIRYRVRHADGSTRVLETWGLNRSTDPIIGGWLLHSKDVTEHVPRAASALERVSAADLLSLALVDARVQGSSVGLIVVDVDRFRSIAGGVRSEVAERLVRDVGDRLRSVLHGGDRFARLGADEFVLVAAHADEASTRERIDAVLAVMAQPFDIEGRAHHFATAVGAALYPEHGLDARALLRHANAAARVAKRERADFAFYNLETDRSAAARVTSISALRDAIASNKLTLHYQPIFDVRTKEVVQAEALCRWPGGPAGVDRPDEFIPLAEHAGLIGALTEWVVQHAAAQWCRWGGAAPPSLALNVSMENLCEPGLADRFDRIFAKSGLAPSRICLELTESALMVDVERSVRTLEELAGLGVRFAIDDFGTGYTSLSYLKRFPVAELKIDRTFVSNVERDPHDAAIVRSIIDLAHGLGLVVVAEGVESPGALELLEEWECDQVQGHILAPAMPEDDFDWWFARTTR